MQDLFHVLAKKIRIIRKFFAFIGKGRETNAQNETFPAFFVADALIFLSKNRKFRKAAGKVKIFFGKSRFPSG